MPMSRELSCAEVRFQLQGQEVRCEVQRGCVYDLRILHLNPGNEKSLDVPENTVMARRGSVAPWC